MHFLIGSNLTSVEKEVIEWLSERNLLPSPELVNHVAKHPKGISLLEKSVNSLDGSKLFFGVSDLVAEESFGVPKPISRPKVANIPPVVIERQIRKSMADGKLESYVSRPLPPAPMALKGYDFFYKKQSCKNFACKILFLANL